MKKLVVLSVLLSVMALPAAAQRGFLDEPVVVPGLGGLGIGTSDAQELALDRQDLAAARQLFARYLGLSPEQMAQWDQLLATLRQTVAPLRTQIETLEGQLRQLLGSSNPDPAAVGSLVLQIKGLGDQVRAAHEAYVAGFEQMLTEEQRAKLRIVRRLSQYPQLIPSCRLLGLCR